MYDNILLMSYNILTNILSSILINTSILLGDVCTGKSTLIDRLCQTSGSGKSRRGQGNQGKYLLSGCSLEYRFIDVYDDEVDGELATPMLINGRGHSSL